MQTVSGAFTTAAAAPANKPTFGVLISWLKNFNSGVQFFQIGVSPIGGTHPIKSNNADITLFDKFDYMEENQYVNNLTVERTISTIPIGIMSAQLDLELDNTSKRFLPGFDGTIGSYINKPGRPVKVNSGFDLEALPQFTGFTGRPKVSLGKRKYNVHAFDAMEFLNNFESSLAMQTNISTKNMIALLLAEAGFASTNYILEDSVQSNLAFIAAKGWKTGPLIQKLVEAEGGIFFFDEQGIARFWNRLHFDLNSTAVGTLNYSNLMDLQFKDTPIINHVIVTAKPRAVTANQLIYRLAQAVEVQPGQVVRYPFAFKDDDGDLPATTIDTPVYVDSQITSFYKTNVKTDGSGEPDNAFITMTDFDTWGTGGEIEFTNSSTSDTVYITDLQIYGTPAKVLTTIVEEYKDQTSINDFGLNPDNSGAVMEVNNDYIQDRTTAYVYAFNIVDKFKNPVRQFTGVPFSNPAWQFGDVFNVNVEDTAQTFKMVMLGNKLNMDRTTALSQSMTLEERIFRNYFQIGVSQIGGLDAIHP
jgi:hypothetical protein